MSGGEPSSIKRDRTCAVRVPVPWLYAEDFPYLKEGFMYQALYRKWRPQTFDQVVGQGHITETLKNGTKFPSIAKTIGIIFLFSFILHLRL